MPEADQGAVVTPPQPLPDPPVPPAPPTPPVQEPAQVKPADDPPSVQNETGPAEPEKPKYEWPSGPIGQIVHYMLSETDVAAINRRRGYRGAPVLGQKHVGNYEAVGVVRPMMITRLWDDHHVSGQVFLDGNDVLWVVHIKDGDEPGNFHG